MKEKELLLVRKFDSVRERLRENCTNGKEAALFALWVMLSTRGEEYAKKMCSKSTYYRNIKALKELQISWENTDLCLVENNCNDVLANFYPSHDSDRLVDEHSEFVKESMLKFLKNK